MIAQPVTGDRAASALVASMEQMVKGLGGDAFIRPTGDAALIVTGLAFPTMNGVLTVRTSASAQEVDELLDDPALRGVAHCVQLRPGCSQQLTQLVARRGMRRHESLPLMAMAAPAPNLGDFAGVERLTIRVADPAEAGVHARIAADAFEAPVELFDAFATPDVLGQPGFRTYLGFVDDVPVTTAIGVRGDDYVGIFDVATPTEYRGRGYGAAITAMAVLDGFGAGASYAFLQSSEMGYGVYERLGFETLESWSVWISAPQSRS